MTLASGHGKGANRPHIELPGVDGLAKGEAAPKPPPMPRPPYAAGSSEAREAGRRGGVKRGGQTRLAERTGLRSLADSAAFAPYKRAAVSFRRAQCATLSSTVGGGLCGPGPSSFVASAALQLAWSRYLGDLAAETNDPDMAMKASKLADASRQNLLAAHELCAREGEARRKGNPLGHLNARLAQMGTGPRKQ